MDADIAADYCGEPDCIVPRHAAVLRERSLAWPILTYEAGSHQSDSKSQLCVDSASAPCIRSTYLRALDAWKAIAVEGGYGVRHFLQFHAMSRYARGGQSLRCEGGDGGTLAEGVGAPRLEEHARQRVLVARLPAPAPECRPSPEAGAVPRLSQPGTFGSGHTAGRNIRHACGLARHKEIEREWQMAVRSIRIPDSVVAVA